MAASGNIPTSPANTQFFPVHSTSQVPHNHSALSNKLQITNRLKRSTKRKYNKRIFKSEYCKSIVLYTAGLTIILSIIIAFFQ